MEKWGAKKNMLNKILLMLKGFIVTIRDRTKETWLFWSDSKTTTYITGFTKNIGSLSLFIISALAVIYLIFLAYGEVTKDTIIIEPFEVPTELQNKGYTGKTLAQELYDQFTTVQDTASHWSLSGDMTLSESNKTNQSNKTLRKEQDRISDKIRFPWEDENIEISGEKISINSLKSILRPIKTLTHKNTYHISGAIQEASESNTFQIIARCNDVYYMSSVAVTKENLQTELLKSAAELYQTINPNTSATYYMAMDTEEDDIKAIKIINKKLINNIDNKNNYLKGQLLLAYIDYIHYRDNVAMARLDKTIEISKRLQLNIDTKTLSDIYYLYGLILTNKSDPDYNNAEIKLSIAYNYNNNSPLIYNTWGIVLYRLNKYNEAIQKYEKAIELNPDNNIFYDNLGLALYKLNRYDEAIQKYEIAMELNPNDKITAKHWLEAKEAKRKTQ